MGARYYESSSGRFLSPDPYGHAASLSLYDYAGGDPINFVDPTGRLQVALEQGEVSYKQLQKMNLTPAEAEMIIRALGKQPKAGWLGRLLMGQGGDVPVQTPEQIKRETGLGEEPGFLQRTPFQVTALRERYPGLSDDEIAIREANRINDLQAKKLLFKNIGGDDYKRYQVAVALFEIADLSSLPLGLATRPGSSAPLAAPQASHRVGDVTDNFSSLRGVGGSNERYTLGLYDPKFAATQALDGGQVSLNRLKALVPEGTPNTFKPSGTINFGQKFQFEINSTKMEVKFYSPDFNAALKFPGSNSGTQWTAQIKVGNKYLGADGKFHSKPSNNTHIPILEIPK